MSFSVEKIFGLTKFEFIESYWEKKPLHVTRPEVCTEIGNIARIKTEIEILKHYRSPSLAIGPAVKDETDFIFDRIMVFEKKALELYNRGCSLELDRYHECCPRLENALNSLAADIGLPQGAHKKSIVYLSNKDSGFPAHFDGYTNIIFQITGNKTWHLADNTSVVKPTLHLELSETDHLPDELRDIWTGPTKDLKPQFRKIDLKAGDILLLPRGVWHATNAAEPSISVNFTYSVPTLADTISSAFKKKMLRHFNFRELTNDASLLSLNKEQLTEFLPSSSESIEETQKDWDIAQRVQASFRQRIWES